MKDLEVIEDIKVDTPFGSPSNNIVIGKLDGVKLAFLPRHELFNNTNGDGVKADS